MKIDIVEGTDHIVPHIVLLAYQQGLGVKLPQVCPFSLSPIYLIELLNGNDINSFKRHMKAKEKIFAPVHDFVT